MFKNVTAKLHTMRKPQNFTVMSQTDGKIMVQSARSIGVFDPETGEGRLSMKGSDFISLSMRSVPYTFPDDFRQECVAALAEQGPVVDLGVVQVNTVIKVI